MMRQYVNLIERIRASLMVLPGTGINFHSR